VASEGFAEHHGYRTWYRVSGEAAPGTLPLLCLHGGPGSSHAYFSRLEELLSREGRQVVVYDQLGCGNSDRPDDVEWSVQLFVDEVAVVREQLGLDRIHLLGRSWGGVLALEYVVTNQDGLRSLILSSTLASVEQWADEQRRLLEALGPGAGEEEYAAAHFVRGDPPPEIEQWKAKRNVAVYEAMWGPNEWTVDGVLAGWDVRDRLGEIRVPTLVTSGRYDACTPAIAETLVRGIPGAEHALFEHGAHVPFLEESERYRDVLVDFLRRAEA
jgi:pimeloyl-ACP methyl ester carboxylesterase